MGSNVAIPSSMKLLDMRRDRAIPDGRCIYIQSGDPGDFDGKYIRNEIFYLS